MQLWGGTMSPVPRGARSVSELLVFYETWHDCELCGGELSVVIETRRRKSDGVIFDERVSCLECELDVYSGRKHVSKESPSSVHREAQQ
jgi:hypothetical protein